MFIKRLSLALLFTVVLCTAILAQPGAEKKIQTEMILVEDGGNVTLDAGTFSITGTLSMDGKKKVIIRGQGIDKTILSFKAQQTGAEGIRITNCEEIVLEDLTVQDAKGDLIKTMHVKGITFRRVKAEWTGKASSKNGGYALYPVQCEKVLIDSCIAIGASDAGIYVGQSKYIEVRNCTAFNNVAGIEIENSLYADVHHNTAVNNTGGILVFDLPDLVQKKGGFVKVHDNIIRENNFSNFAPKGNIVAKVPKGTGVLVLATSHVELFSNSIINNRTMGVGVISYFITENKIKDKAYDPYPSGINIHDNTFEKKKGRAPMAGRIGQLYRFKLKFGRNLPDIIFDGITNPAAVNSKVLCIRNNHNQSFANLDAANDFRNITRSLTGFECELPPVTVN
jgi:parallel beta-helix repeat protein